ncbi:hemagglutinin repeat-containing protein, partial [Leminorella grimontii]
MTIQPGITRILSGIPSVKPASVSHAPPRRIVYTLFIQSGGDTTLSGAAAKGSSIIADVGKNLT